MHARRVSSSSRLRSSNEKSCNLKYADEGILRRCQNKKVIKIVKSKKFERVSTFNLMASSVVAEA